MTEKSIASESRKKVSLLIPVYNESASLPLLLAEIASLMKKNSGYDWEVMLVNDGSTDSSLEIMRQQHLHDPRFRYIDLSRNFGKEHALHAGFDYVTGDCVVILDADLQHPVEVIPDMVGKWEEGYDDVYGHRLTRGEESFLRRTLSLGYYRILHYLADDKETIQQNVGDFRLLDRKCVDAICSLHESGRYTKGLYSYIGFKKTCVDFEQKDRLEGESKQNYRRLFSLAVDGITSHSTKPLRLATISGALISFFTLCYIVFIILKTLIVGEPVAGFPTLMVVILFLGGMQLLAIGIIGEYLGRIFNEVKQRPDYFVRESDGMTVRRSRK